MVADDPSENDNNPAQRRHQRRGESRVGRAGDACRSVRPAAGAQVIEVTVSRTDTTEIERGYTGQRGQDEQNRRARKAAVQTPGKALTCGGVSISTGTSTSC